MPVVSHVLIPSRSFKQRITFRALYCVRVLNHRQNSRQTSMRRVLSFWNQWTFFVSFVFAKRFFVLFCFLRYRENKCEKRLVQIDAHGIEWSTRPHVLLGTAVSFKSPWKWIWHGSIWFDKSVTNMVLNSGTILSSREPKLHFIFFHGRLLLKQVI